GCDGLYVNAPGQLAMHDRRDLLNLVHHARELVRIDGLRTVRERLLRLMVHFNHHTICTDGNRSARHWQHFVALARAVAWVDKDWQVAELLHGGNNAEVERITRVIGKRAHAALAEDHFVVALAHDVLGGHEKFVERGRHAAFEQHRHAQTASALEQRKILHVARANLHDVSPLRDQIEGFIVDGFGDDAQAKLIPDLRHDFERIDAEALKCVWRGAGLVGASAEELGTRGGNLLGDGESLFAALDGAGPGHDGEVATADGGVGAGKADDGIFFFDVAASELVGL